MEIFLWVCLGLFIAYIIILAIQYMSGKRYYPSGALKSEKIYEGNRLQSLKIYYENGALQTEIPYKDKKANGIAKIYHTNGVLIGEVHFRNGNLIDKKFHIEGLGKALECEHSVLGGQPYYKRGATYNPLSLQDSLDKMILDAASVQLAASLSKHGFIPDRKLSSDKRSISKLGNLKDEDMISEKYLDEWKAYKRENGLVHLDIPVAVRQNPRGYHIFDIPRTVVCGSKATAEIIGKFFKERTSKGLGFSLEYIEP